MDNKVTKNFSTEGKPVKPVESGAIKDGVVKKGITVISHLDKCSCCSNEFRNSSICGDCLSDRA